MDLSPNILETRLITAAFVFMVLTELSHEPTGDQTWISFTAQNKKPNLLLLDKTLSCFRMFVFFCVCEVT